MSSTASGAAIAPTPARHAFGASLRRFRLVFLAGLISLSLIAIEAPAIADAKSPNGGRSEASRIVAHARSHIGKRFQLGTEGPRRFDCSGLVYRVYKEAGLLHRVGGARRLAAGYYGWFKSRGKADRRSPQVGDLIVWRKKSGRRISHMGIYIGGGRVISALINPWGVRSTRGTSLRGMRMVAYLHVSLDR